MINSYDILDLTNPYPFFKWARANNPIFFDEKSGYWVVTKYTDIKYILGTEESFSAELERMNFSKLSSEALTILRPINFEELYGLSTTENPAHDRVKKVALPLFNELFTNNIKPELDSLIDDYLQAVKATECFDILANLFYELPAAIIFLLLGIPKEEISQVKRWSSSRMALTWGNKDDQVINAQNIVKYWNYTKELIDSKIAHPQNDLPSRLLENCSHGQLTLEDIQLLCYGLIFSGHTTTSAFLSESLKVLLSSGKWSEFRENESLVSNSVDELLRYCPSVFTRRRTALHELEIGGKTIRQSDKLLLVLGSANRDEEVFDQPDELILGRKNSSKHLSFGNGFHYCIGAKLVKLEYATVMSQLSRNFPGLKLAINNSFEYQRSISIRALVDLNVCVD